MAKRALADKYLAWEMGVTFFVEVVYEYITVLDECGGGVNEEGDTVLEVLR